MIFILSVVYACNNTDKTTANTTIDSSSTSATHENMDHSNMNMDSAGQQGKTMMTMMNGMMDNMRQVKSSGNLHNDFAALMKAHHLGAIEMAQLEVTQGTDAQMKQMAQKMIDDQQKEVTDFNTLLATHNAGGEDETFFAQAMATMTNMKMEMDHSGSVDQQFAQMMIPHHQSAIDMSKAYLKQPMQDAQIKKMAMNIISSQQKEIGELKSWLRGK